MKTEITMKPDALQLRRLEILADVIFALAMVHIFLQFPRPTPGENLAAFFSDSLGTIAVVLVGFAFLIVYWIQNNAVFGVLAKTDNRHTVIGIVQLITVLMFLYAVKLGVDFDGDLFAMIFESCVAALMGFLSLVNWSYATKDRRLLFDDITDEEVKRRTRKLWPEPATAILTIPCAFLGPVVWTIAWFVIMPIAARAAKARVK